MLQKIRLATSGLEVTRIGLGLSRLHHLMFDRDRRRLIEEAIGIGVTHFDAARLYGDGLAERVLGRALGSKRESVTISTKFGLVPLDWLGAIGSPARVMWAARPFLRRAGLSQWPRRSFSVATFKQSLATSLRCLRTDYIDVLLLHEPAMIDFEQNPDLPAALLAEKQAGRVRHLGLSGSDLSAIVQRYPNVFDVIQMPERDRDSITPDITFSVLTSVPGNKSNSDMASRAIVGALARRPGGAVLVGTTKIDHLKAIVRAVEQADDLKKADLTQTGAV